MDETTYDMFIACNSTYIGLYFNFLFIINVFSYRGNS
jgi:hypothetical protein